MVKNKRILKELEKKLDGKSFEEIGEAILEIPDSHCTVCHLGEWEYKTIIAGRGGGIIQQQLEEMKSNGWILESQNGLEYIFKRKIQQ